VLRTLLMLDLESHPPPAAIDIVTIEIDPAPGRVIQYSLLERAVPSAETVATLTARLGALVGDTRCGSPALVDTHQPDGFEMRRFELPAGGQIRKAGLSSALSAGSEDPALHHEMPDLHTHAIPHRRRAGSSDPARREPDDPVHRPALVPVLRRFRPPVAVRVTVERGRPVQLAIDRRGMPGGAIERSAGPWRTSGAWWTGTPDGWDRDEWDIVLRDGTICRLFQQRDTGTWLLEGVLD
jgi:hypothetical protein